MVVEQLAYEEAKRAIDRQSNSLDELRGRAGILLAAPSLATSFFSGLALSGEDLSECMTIAVIIAFLFAAGACIAVRWPHKGKGVFNLSAEGLITLIDAKAADEATVLRQLVRRHEANYRENEKRLKVLYWFFRGACLALAVEVFLWIVLFAP